jgi:hypothetical protein
MLLLGDPGGSEHVLGALLEYAPGGRTAGDWGQPEGYAMGIVQALAHYTPLALSGHAPVLRRLRSLLEHGHSRTICAGAAVRCIGVGGLCQSRHSINRLLVEGSRPMPPVDVLQALIRFVCANSSALSRVPCGYTHRWNGPSLLHPPGIAPEDEREPGEDRGEGEDGEWQWLTNRIWNEDDEYAAVSTQAIRRCL